MDSGKEVRDDAHLIDSFHLWLCENGPGMEEDGTCHKVEVAVVSPFLFGQMPVDGPHHVPWRGNEMGKEGKNKRTSSSDETPSDSWKVDLTLYFENV
jgi:hypothetical protein